ncbi:MAG: inositol monophosphatase [Pseudomonadota bacterium]
MSFYPPLDQVEAIMRETADALILPRFRSLGDDEVSEKKGPDDLVTIADREAEVRLTSRLEALVPGSKVVGEEAVSQGLTSVDILREDRDLWLVDPVDGTLNFVEGLERFGVMVAFIRGGEVRQSWILLPVSGHCAVASKGDGATFDGHPMRPRRNVPFAEAYGDYSRIYVDEEFRPILDNGVKGSAGTIQGRCSAWGYTDLARGEIDYYVQYVMTPWDHAAGQLIVEEAGGRFAFMPGGEPYTPLPHKDQPMLAVADADMWQDYAARLMAN